MLLCLALHQHLLPAKKFINLDLQSKLRQLRLHKTDPVSRLMPPLFVQLPELCLIDRMLDLRLGLLHEQLHLRYVQLYVLNLRGCQQHSEVFSLLRVDISRLHHCFLQKLPNRGFSLHKCHSHIAMPIRVLSDIKFSILPGMPIKLSIMPFQ